MFSLVKVRSNLSLCLFPCRGPSAIITGTIRHHNLGSRLHGQPIQKPGKVFARMTMRLDPYTGRARPDTPLVDAVGYFNDKAQGHYEIHGLAPGVYDLYASASGFPQTLIQHSVTVLKDQSLHLDGYLQPGVMLHGKVFSKRRFDGALWTEDAYVKIELYDGPTLGHVPDPSASLVSWSGGTSRNHIPVEQDVGPPQVWSVRVGTHIHSVSNSG